MGFIERIRPNPNLALAERHYAEAIRLQPDWCGANAYRTELLLEEEMNGGADSKAVDAQYRAACKTCGEWHRAANFTDGVRAVMGRNFLSAVQTRRSRKNRRIKLVVAVAVLE